MTSLYRLDQIDTGAENTDSENLGPLPNTSKALLGGLTLVWLWILGYALREKLRCKKRGI